MKKQPKRTTKRDKKRLTKDLSAKDAGAVKGGAVLLNRKAGKDQQEYL
jgi:hypothetical protein